MRIQWIEMTPYAVSCQHASRANQSSSLFRTVGSHCDLHRRLCHLLTALRGQKEEEQGLTWSRRNIKIKIIKILTRKRLDLETISHCDAHGAPGFLRLLGDGAVVLRLILSQRGVRLREQRRSAPQGPLQQEPPGGHQLAVALRVGEGVARAAGADAPGGRAARRRGRQRLLPQLVSHLEDGQLMKTSRYAFIHLLMGVVCRLTLSLTVGRSWMRMKRKATTGRMQSREVRKMVSQTLGWIREFLAVPGISKTRQTPSARIPR
ncbi:hypothetical protein EYF80_010867 [Liparis tanakae]|uniref:Uncharacterized protein n=1 Tax=Liparis tanakae TaxID=230148 RepID=A0A4Z2IMD1_9TELE|nr:hypothetical protein EYF80_010867 [Liparis tanakae]